MMGTFENCVSFLSYWINFYFRKKTKLGGIDPYIVQFSSKIRQLCILQNWIGEGKCIITGFSHGFKHEIIALITLHGGLEAGN